MSSKLTIRLKTDIVAQWKTFSWQTASCVRLVDQLGKREGACTVVFATLSEHDTHTISVGHEKLLDQQDKHKKKEDKTCRPEHACMSSEYTACVAMASIFKVALYKYLSCTSFVVRKSNPWALLMYVVWPTLVCLFSVPRNFYPFGDGAGDQTLPRNDFQTSVTVQLPVSFPIGEEDHPRAVVSVNVLALWRIKERRTRKNCVLSFLC